ncbi:Uncharacterised protein [Mycobacteroides abscessus subsp. abscessus]|nr:Uncharacterised protein [Mycobacteroides abscessus subsp. abscessus]
MLLAQRRELPQPLGPGSANAALALDGLDDDRRGLVDTRAGVLEHPLEPEEVRGLPVEVVFVGDLRTVRQRDARTLALHRVPGHRQRPERHPVERVRE